MRIWLSGPRPRIGVSFRLDQKAADAVVIVFLLFVGVCVALNQMGIHP